MKRINRLGLSRTVAWTMTVLFVLSSASVLAQDVYDEQGNAGADSTGEPTDEDGTKKKAEPVGETPESVARVLFGSTGTCRGPGAPSSRQAPEAGKYGFSDLREN